jgi:hypothetical protein
MNYNCIFNSIIDQVQALLESQEFLDAHRFPNHFVRKRLLSMYQVVIYILYTSKQKMETNICRLRDLGDPLSFPKISKQALSKARQGINPSLFSVIFNLTVDTFYHGNPTGKLWKGRFRVFGIDGSKIELPRTKSNFVKYGEMFSKKNENRRWSMALVSIIYDVSNDFICHGLIRPFLASERAAAIRHCEALAGTGVFSMKSVLIFDRGYYSEDMFRYFSENGYKCVMRLKEGFKISKSCTGDCVQTLEGDPEKGTADCPVRVISVPLQGGTTEYLATNIFDESLTREDFKELYFLRWPVELKYAELKNRLLMEEFSGATSTSVEQEFYANLFYANLASLVKSEADPQIEKRADPDNKYRYQANRSFIYGRLKDLIAPVLCHTQKRSKLDEVFEDACGVKSQIMPGRSTPRKRINKERSHHNNRKTAV